MNEEKVLLIPKIENGIVIDHIPSGLGIPLLRSINSHTKSNSVHITLGLNYKSSKLGRKDLLKLDIDDLPQEVLQQIALIAPGVTIKRIKNFEVDKKYVLDTPDNLVGLVICRNPNCITNHERAIETRYNCINRDERLYKCEHCERIFHLSELERVAASSETGR